MTKRIAWNRGRGMSAESKLWASVVKTNTCWLWTGNKVGIGYGAIFIWENGRCRGLRAHRVSWELKFGPVPHGQLVLHKCDVPACVNPDHLWLGTQAENMADKVSKNRQARGLSHGSKTQPDSVCRGSKHWMSVLSPLDVSLIRSADVTNRGARAALARRFVISKTQITRILNGKSWRIMPPPL